MTRYPALFFSAAALLITAACAHPSPIPTGYVYHDGLYKSALPPESSKVTKAQRAVMGPEQAQQFRTALYDLVDRLTDRAGLPPKSVYVLPHDPMNAFFAQVDNDLREAMRHTGYTLAASPDNAYTFTYDALLIEKPELDPVEYPQAAVASDNNVEIILKVFKGAGEQAAQLTEERGLYRIDGAEQYFGSALSAFSLGTGSKDSATPSRQDDR